MDEAAQSEAPKSGSPRGGSLSWLVWTLSFFLLVYPLSVGPAAKLLGPNPPEPVRIIYAPLGYLTKHSQSVRSFYGWYGKLWGVDLYWWPNAKSPPWFPISVD